MKKPFIPRIWVFRIATAVLAPVLFLLLVEGGLRLCGYGDPVRFFLPLAGQDALTGNPRYTYRYFPKPLVREPDLIRMDREKPDDVYRIFVLGGSAARGTPDPRFGFGRILEVMLEETFPDRRFEVINTAMVAINSHVVLRIARECAEHDPDLFVVYLGNNEVAGPFGASPVLTQPVPGRTMVALSLAAKGSRTGQLIGNIAQGLGKGSAQTEWLGMEMFLQHRVAAGDPRLEKVYRHFEANLDDIAETARGAGVPLILCTVPVNLRNCAPLASDHSASLAAADLEAWEKLVRAGAELEAQERWAEADDHYQRAETIDDQYAELHFRRARCALAQGNVEAARRHFTAARDLDTLRFRADSEINRIIRSVGGADSVFLLDADEGFTRLSQVPHGIPGEELFYEHVHFTFGGNYELARMVFEESIGRLDDAPADVAPPSRERCAELLGLSGRDRYQMASSMMNLVVVPPFTEQLDYYERCGKLHARIRSLAAHTSEEGLEEAEWALTTALEPRPHNLHGRVALVRLQLMLGKGREVEATLAPLMRSLPDRADLHALLGQALLIRAREAEAGEAFEKAFTLATQPAEYMVLAAEHYQHAGNSERALALCHRALEIQPNSANRLNRLAEIHLQRGEKKEALTHLQRADSLLTGNGRILFNLSRAHFESGQLESAVGKLRETLQANPFHLGARMHLGLILKKEGKLEEAAALLAEVIRHETHRLDLRLHLAETRAAMGQLDQAGRDYRALMQAAPERPEPALGLAWVLAVRSEATPGERREAVALAEGVVRATGRRAARPLDVLAAALAASGQFDQAQGCAEEALGLALNGRDEAFSKAVSERLGLYRQHMPYRLPDGRDD